MNKIVAISAVALSLFISSNQCVNAETVIESTGTQAPFQGTLKPFQNTPKPFEQLEFRSAAMQPDDVRTYLQQMRDIMKRYTDCVFSVITSNGSTQPGPEAMAQASEQTKQLANEIAGVKAPSEVAGEHKQLAMTLANVNNFLTSNNGAGPAALPQAMGMIGSVQSTMVGYRNATQNLIHKYGLPQSLDPLLGDQNTSDKQRQLTGMMSSMKDSLMMQNAGGMQNLGGMTNMPGMSGMGGMGGMDLGSMFGDTTGGALPNLDVNGLMKQMSNQNEIMQQLLGE